jgi:hypothetical protein
MTSPLLAQQIVDITAKYMFYSDLFNLVVGIIGNVSIILIFTTLRLFRGNQCAFYLTMGAVADIGVMLSYLPPDIAVYTLGQNLALTSIVWCKIQVMCLYGFGLDSLFTVCLLAFDQYLSTNHRYNWRQQSTLKLARRLVFYTACFAFLHSILFLVFAEIGTLGCKIYDPIAKIYFTFFYYPILSTLLPLTVSVSFSLLAYRSVRRLVRRQVPVIRRRLDRQLTAIALARVFCIAILGIPFIILCMYELNTNYSETDYTSIAIENLVSAVIYSSLYANFSVS